MRMPADETTCKHDGWRHSQRSSPSNTGVHVMEWCDECGALLKDYVVPLPPIEESDASL